MAAPSGAEGLDMLLFPAGYVAGIITAFRTERTTARHPLPAPPPLRLPA